MNVHTLRGRTCDADTNGDIIAAAVRAAQAASVVQLNREQCRTSKRLLGMQASIHTYEAKIRDLQEQLSLTTPAQAGRPAAGGAEVSDADESNNNRTIIALREGAASRRQELRDAQTELSFEKEKCARLTTELAAQVELTADAELRHARLSATQDREVDIGSEMRIAQLECEVNTLLMTLASVEANLCALDVACDGLPEACPEARRVKCIVAGISAVLEDETGRAAVVAHNGPPEQEEAAGAVSRIANTGGTVRNVRSDLTGP